MNKEIKNEEILLLLKEYSKQHKLLVTKFEKLERKLEKIDIQVRSLKDEKNI